MSNSITPPPSTLKSDAEIWTNIYSTVQKGRDPGEKFFSGSGSHDEKIIVPYINTLIPLLMNNDIRNIVDLGCGDFWIMRRVLGALDEAKYNYFYTGIDVTKELVEYNTKQFKAINKRFIFMDAAADDTLLPDGDILIIRQVLQHLSNTSIKKILSKASKFKYLFVTEHIYDASDAVHNVDKLVTDNSIKLKYKSGLYLEHAPFNYKNIVHLLKVAQMGGIIRSSLIIN